MKISNLLTLLKVGADVKLSKEQAQHLADLIEQQQARIAELEAAVERLREQLSAMATQHQCGCGHPACNRCRDDDDNREVLYRAKINHPSVKDGE